MSDATIFSSKSILDEMRDCMTEFGGYSNRSRLIPHVGDGLLPVYRRALLATRGFSKNTKSMAAIADTLKYYHPHGDCVRHDTLIWTNDGKIRKIGELYQSGVREFESLSWDETSKSVKASRAHSLRVGQFTDKVYKVTLASGEKVECTSNHPFLIVTNHKNDAGQFSTRNLENKWISAEDLKEGMIILSGNIEISEGSRPTVDSLFTRKSRVESLVHATLSNDSEGVWHHSNEDKRDNSKSNLVKLTRAEHAAAHQDYLEGLRLGRESMFSGADKERIHKKNSDLMKNANEVQNLRKAFQVLDLVLSSGSDLNEDSYNLFRAEVYNAPKLKNLSKLERFGVKDLESLLVAHEISGGKASYFNSSKVKAQGKVGEVEVVRKYTVGMKKTLRKCINESGEFFSKVLSIEIEEVDGEPMYDFTVDEYENLLTPLSSSEGRVNWVCLHNSSVKPVIDTLVRRKLLEGQGNFGARLLEDIGAAAPRYTEIKRKNEVCDVLFKLLDYAPHFRNEMGTNEPNYLITPVPLALVYGQMGIGLGCATRIPAFTFESLVEAHRHDDPKYLRLNFGYRLTGGQIKDLWFKGTGRLQIEMDVEYEKSSEDDGIWVSRIKGSGELFKPALGQFDDLVDSGKVFIRDESTTHVDVVIGRTKGTKVISSDEIYQRALKCARFNRKYDIRVNVNGCIRRVGIRDWLQVTMTNYKNQFEQWRTDKTADLRDKIFAHLITPPTAKMIQQEMSDDKILKELNKLSLPEEYKEFDRKVTLDDIKSVMKRPIKMLRQKDFSSEVESLKAQLDEAMRSDHNADIDVAGKVLRYL